MLTKIDCINIIQLELAQGKITADLYQEFSVPEISRILGSVLDSICMKDSVTRNAMAKEYVIDCVEVNGVWMAPLSPLPLSGTYSFAYIKDSQTQYVLRNQSMGNAIDAMRGGTYYGNATLITSDKLELSSKPQGVFRAAYIPNVYLMEDNDELILPATESLLIASTIQFIQNARNPIRAQEMANNGRIDAKP